MIWFKKQTNTIYKNPFVRQYIRFRSSIYGRVVFIITLLSLFLFFSFGFIFRSVHNQYLNTVILQNGNNIGSIVESSLYHSMLENDKSRLQSTLDAMNNMSGIDELNLYDSKDSLVYSSSKNDKLSHGNPDCRSCHDDLGILFPEKEKSYRILDLNNDCVMEQNSTQRHLYIKQPILNEPSCYTSACHAHRSTDEVLGSLIIKMPLCELDAAVKQFSTNFYMLATFSTFSLALFLILFTNKKIKNPLNALIKASRAVASGDLSFRMDVKPRQLDDMRMVSMAFNNMLDNLSAANNELAKLVTSA